MGTNSRRGGMGTWMGRGGGLFFYDDLGGEKTNGEVTRVFQVMVRRACEG